MNKAFFVGVSCSVLDVGAQAVGRELAEDRFENSPGNIGETEIPSGITIGQSLMVETQEVQDCGMEVMDMNSILDAPKTKLIGLPVSHSPSHTTTGEPRRKAMMIMVATIPVFTGGCPAKFTAPEDERFVEQSTLLQIGQQGGDRAIDIGTQST